MVSASPLNALVQSVQGQSQYRSLISRRFFIIGSTIALIGSIIGAVAKDVNTLIAAETLIGIAVAFQQSFFWVVSEIVPMKYRYLANSVSSAVLGLRQEVEDWLTIQTSTATQ